MVLRRSGRKMSQGGGFGLPGDQWTSCMREWSWARAGSWRLLAFADAEVRREEELRESMVS